MPTAKQGYFNAAGVQIPGCTTVMQSLSFGSADPLMYWAIGLAKQGLDPKTERQRAADLGTFIHDCLEQFPAPLPQRPGWMTNDEWQRVLAAYTNYAEWDAQVQPQVLHHEVQLVSEEYQYGGCFDLVARIGDTVVLLDHKTGKTADKLKWAVQLGAYRQLIEENKLVDGHIREAIVLHYPVLKFRPVQITSEQLDQGFALFKTALQARRLFQGFPK
jgi:hypothetical protein